MLIAPTESSVSFLRLTNDEKNVAQYKSRRVSVYDARITNDERAELYCHYGDLLDFFVDR